MHALKKKADTYVHTQRTSELTMGYVEQHTYVNCIYVAQFTKVHRIQQYLMKLPIKTSDQFYSLWMDNTNYFTQTLLSSHNAVIDVSTFWKLIT